jgi:hypothetical protein
MIPEAFKDDIRTQKDLDELINQEIKERVGDMHQKPIVYDQLYEEQEKAIKEHQPLQEKQLQPINEIEYPLIKEKLVQTTQKREYQHQI